MNLIELRKQYKELNRKANDIKESLYYLPLAEIENENFTGNVWCTVENVDLSENYVELSYVDEDESCWTAVSIEKFTELVSNIIS